MGSFQLFLINAEKEKNCCKWLVNYVIYLLLFFVKGSYKKFTLNFLKNDLYHRKVNSLNLEIANNHAHLK